MVHIPMYTHELLWAPSMSQEHTHAAHVAQRAFQAPQTSLALPAYACICMQGCARAC